MVQSPATQNSTLQPSGHELEPLYHLLERDDVGELLASDISLQLLLINAVCRARGLKTNDWDTRSLARALYKLTDEGTQGRCNEARRKNGRKGGRPPNPRDARAMRAGERVARRTRMGERATLDVDQRTPEREVYRNTVDALCESQASPFHGVAPTERDRSQLADNMRKVRQRWRAKLFGVVEAADRMSQKQGAASDGPAS